MAMNRQPAVSQWRVVLVLAVAAVGLIAFSVFADTGPWPDGMTTPGRVVSVQDRWLKSGGSASVSYEVDGVPYERWFPDVAEHGRVAVGDEYLLEYRAGDPLNARGMVANRDDWALATPAMWAGVGMAILAAGAVIIRLFWRQQPEPEPKPRRAR